MLLELVSHTLPQIERLLQQINLKNMNPSKMNIWGDSLMNNLKSQERKNRKRIASKIRRRNSKKECEQE